MTDIGCPPPWTEHTTGPLAALLADLHYKPGYTFSLWHHDGEVVLAIDHDTVDTYHPGTATLIGHHFPVPPAILNTDRPTVRRWLLDRIRDVDTHEACEWFRERVVEWHVDDFTPPTSDPHLELVRPFDPHHNYRQHAYQIHDWTTT